MRISTKCTLLPVLILTAGWTLCAGATDIYKTVDENGDPVYTDRPPSPDAKPISLRELSVVEAPAYSSSASNRQADDDEDDGPSLNELRRQFRDFRLVSPAPDQNFWGTGNTATIAWDAGGQLENGMQVVYYVDGEAVGDPTTDTTYTTGQLDRGEHQARVDLVDPNNRVVASAGPVTFFIMQNSRQFQN